jgi:hypothetical protein
MVCKGDAVKIKIQVVTITDDGQETIKDIAYVEESREMLGIMPPQTSPQPQGPCPDTSA